MDQAPLSKKKGIADIVFLLDVSGSMAPCIGALRDNIGSFVNSLTTPGPNEASVVKDWRIKVVGYRDAEADGAQWWEESPFRTDVAQVVADLQTLDAKGGGDEPESLLDALWKLAKMPAGVKGAAAESGAWRYPSDAARVVVVFSDATYKPRLAIPEAAGAGFDDVVREVHASGLRLSCFVPEHDCYHQLSGIDKSEVQFVGSLSDARAAMQTFTSDPANFRKTLEVLGKTITQSAAVETL